MRQPIKPASGLAALFIVALSCAAICSCIPRAPSRSNRGSGCGWNMAAEGRNAPQLGPNDFHAGYMGYVAKVEPGARVVVRAQFPHCRYISFVLYDQDMMVADALPDYSIVPLKGVNPFLPGAVRSTKYLGEYELQVVMDPPPPAGQRKPNTLYAGRAANGKKNHDMILAYRVYLPDKGYGFEDNNPLAVYGGVEPGMVKFYAPGGAAQCLSKIQGRAIYSRLALTALMHNTKVLGNPAAFMRQAKNPVVWMNAASREKSGQSSVVPNEESQYIFAPVTSDNGPLLVLRWKAPVTPEATWTGAPFPKDYDMRYWSLSFAAFKRGEGVGIVTEKTVADVEVPHLPDGSRELVIGFGGMARPGSVPADRWVGLAMKKGIIIMRNIQVRDSWPGNFALLPPGPLTGPNARFTPGGTYCTPDQLAANPDIGLSSGGK